MSDETEYATSLCITGLGAGEQPMLQLCVPIGSTCSMAERILAVVFGNDEAVNAAVERFRGYEQK